MAHSNICTCDICGKKYEYCESCSIVKPIYNADRFCSQAHQDIYAILSKHGCNLITADEALKELSAYNLDEITLTEGILAHIEQIKAEVSTKVEEVAIEEPVVMVEEVVPITENTTVQTTNKNNKKKKW